MKNQRLLSTYKISLNGIVQGVGFRPMLYNYAIDNDLKGYVSNTSDGLHFVFNATSNTAQKIFEDVKSKMPTLAKVVSATLVQISFREFTAFQIAETTTASNKSVLITSDYAICKDCKLEIRDSSNRRYRYPFTTCTVCGPRYSIITDLPFDRCNTTMKPFEMCSDCASEYDDITNRRYYAQTTSCNKCGVQMEVYNALKEKILHGNDQTLPFIAEQLHAGKIIAIKGIGGYLLICDASNAATIENLRKRKKRPSKPFAIMCGDVLQATKYADLCNKEIELLQTPAAPIVVAHAKEKCDIAFQQIAPGLSSIGIMLSYAPLFDIVLNDFGKPIVATSANISGSPIIYANADAIEHLSAFADFVITNNRTIVVPQDDSVITIAPKSKQQIIFRRARGLAPTFFSNYKMEESLATGAMLKSSFAFAAHNNIYISQYLGNTDNYDAQQMYQHTLSHLQKIIEGNNSKVIGDAHPAYFSHQFAKELSTNASFIQHHQAHFLAVLAENDLLSVNNVLGVIWDGTGLGQDGQIHGGEFYKYTNKELTRCYYFDYFPIILGDKMAKEPRISALAICNEILGADEILKNKFSENEWQLYNRMLRQDNLLQCSSVGRIFDAVASLLNIQDIQSYEGEAALKLQQMAQLYFENCNYEFNESYFFEGAHYNRLPTATLFSGIVTDLLRKRERAYIAAKFHFSLIHITKIIACNTGCNKIAFSGGVFQNSLLADLLQLHLSKTHSLYFHKQLSPNDENISLGQLFYHFNNN